MDTESAGVAAWLLQLDRLVNVAIGQFELTHIVDQPEYISIPQAPEHCKDIILWNDNIVPVMNLTSWMSGDKQSDAPGVVAIVVYTGAQNNYLYGGIKLNNPPVQVKVKNIQQCQWTKSLDKWKILSISCFKSQEGEVVPIIDITKVFSQKSINK